ncbi:hypothetical protein AB0N89_20390 [Amycolatopsis sp. NPDC089917]|uniref:hypothetical protein n=1 Tax=Amycolatopsis sp. NPDC089917 TaxID=3155187 RepID=UPI00343AF6A4
MTALDTLVPGPVLRSPELARLSPVGGKWLVENRFTPLRFTAFRVLENSGIVCGVYLITDEEDRVRWLGQACRNDDLVQRLANHHRKPTRRAVFASVRILHLIDHTPQQALNAIEGRCADLLKLREQMGRRRWPSSEGWLEAVT